MVSSPLLPPLHVFTQGITWSLGRETMVLCRQWLILEQDFLVGQHWYKNCVHWLIVQKWVQSAFKSAAIHDQGSSLSVEALKEQGVVQGKVTVAKYQLYRVPFRCRVWPVSRAPSHRTAETRPSILSWTLSSNFVCDHPHRGILWNHSRIISLQQMEQGSRG